MIILPQILITLSDEASKWGASSLLEKLDKSLSPIVRGILQVPEDDVACTGFTATYSRGEKDVQVEVRFTVGTDEYHRGEPFDPPMDRLEWLIRDLGDCLESVLATKGLSFSVWVIPIRDSIFKA